MNQELFVGRSVVHKLFGWPGEIISVSSALIMFQFYNGKNLTCDPESASAYVILY